MTIPRDISSQVPMTTPVVNNKKTIVKKETAKAPEDSFSHGFNEEKQVSLHDIKSKIGRTGINKSEDIQGAKEIGEITKSASIFNMKFAEPEKSVCIDIRRKTKVNDDGEREKLPLSPVGIDMGDGLFLDTTGNITFNPLRGNNEDFDRISVIHPGFSGSTQVYKDGDDAKIVYPGFSGSRTVTKEGNITNIVHPGFQGNTTVREEGNTTIINHPGFAGTTSVIKEGNTTKIIHPGFAGKTVISEEGSTTRLIHPGFAGSTVVSEEGDATKVIHPGFAGATVIRKEGNDTRIIHPGLEGSTIISRNGSNIRIIHPGYGGTTEIRRD